MSNQTNYFTVPDVNGTMVTIDYGKFASLLSDQGFTLFGMSLSTMLKFRELYMKAGAGLPIDVNQIEIKVK